MESDVKRVNWVPFGSFCSLLIILCAIGWWVFESPAGFFGAITIIGVLAVFPKRVASFEDFWDSSIALGTHKTLIVLAFIVLALIVFFVIPNYKIVRRNKP